LYPWDPENTDLKKCVWGVDEQMRNAPSIKPMKIIRYKMFEETVGN
jgi:hypothetical protein